VAVLVEFDGKEAIDGRRDLVGGDRRGNEVADHGDPGAPATGKVVEEELRTRKWPCEDPIGDAHRIVGGPRHREPHGSAEEVLFPRVLSGVPGKDVPMDLAVAMGVGVVVPRADELPDLFRGSFEDAPLVPDEDHGPRNREPQIGMTREARAIDGRRRKRFARERVAFDITEV
jgi:hypothetical protein